MAASNGTTTITYPVTDTVNDVVVEGSLLAELQALSLSELTVETVDVVASDILVGCSYTPADGADLTADENLIEAAVAAHEGEAIGLVHQDKQTNNPPTEITVTDANFGAGDEFELEQLQTTALNAGEYRVDFTAEIESTDVDNDFTIRCHTNGSGSDQNRGEERFEGVCRKVFTAFYNTSKGSGQKQTARLMIDKAGGDFTSGTVLVRNTRLSVTRILEN